jgi:Rrf2 family protein
MWHTLTEETDLKLSTKGEYGLRAMLYLAMKQEEQLRFLHAHTISEAQAIPPHYLKQILIQLRAAGLIRSARGPSGGHALARHSTEISVGEIIGCLEGQLTCVDGILDMPCTIEVGPDHCVIKEFLLDVKDKIERILHGTSLADLSARQSTISELGLVIQPQTTLMKRYGQVISNDKNATS